MMIKDLFRFDDRVRTPAESLAGDPDRWIVLTERSGGSTAQLWLAGYGDLLVAIDHSGDSRRLSEPVSGEALVSRLGTATKEAEERALVIDARDPTALRELRQMQPPLHRSTVVDVLRSIQWGDNVDEAVDDIIRRGLLADGPDGLVTTTDVDEWSDVLFSDDEILVVRSGPDEGASGEVAVTLVGGAERRAVIMTDPDDPRTITLLRPSAETLRELLEAVVMGSDDPSWIPPVVEVRITLAEVDRRRSALIARGGGPPAGDADLLDIAIAALTLSPTTMTLRRRNPEGGERVDVLCLLGPYAVNGSVDGGSVQIFVHRIDRLLQLVGAIMELDVAEGGTGEVRRLGPVDVWSLIDGHAGDLGDAGVGGDAVGLVSSAAVRAVEVRTESDDGETALGVVAWLQDLSGCCWLVESDNGENEGSILDLRSVGALAIVEAVAELLSASGFFLTGPAPRL
jgi:hypothetical protein